MKKYYRIKCIEKNIKWHGTNFWDAGYSYSYIPITTGHEYMFKVLNNFNDKLKHKRHHITIDITRIFEKTQSVIQIKGKRKLVNEFITQLLLSDFANHYTFKKCPYYDINYESYT